MRLETTIIAEPPATSALSVRRETSERASAIRYRTATDAAAREKHVP